MLKDYYENERKALRVLIGNGTGQLMNRGKIAMNKTRNIFLVTAIMIAVLTGCGKSNVVKEPSQMPDIVFMAKYHWYDFSKEDYMINPDIDIRFCDKNGRYCISDDQEVCGMDFKELVSAYADGKLDDKISISSKTCDVDELFENYQKLCEVSKNEELEIVYPLQIPAVEPYRRVWWYGIYYDNKGELQRVMLHEKAETDFDTNDEQANEIYDWYDGTFQK